MKTAINIILAAAGAMAILAAGALLDGPSDADIAAAEAADLVQARHDAALADMRLKRCQALRGPRAEVVLAGIEGQDYVCRVEGGI